MKSAVSRAGKASGAARRGETNVQETFPERSEAGQARDKVGEVLGVSGRTAEKMAVVGRAIREAGDTERAEKLKTLVNDRGVEPAFREVKATTV